jgi:hypothetical protein
LIYASYKKKILGKAQPDTNESKNSVKNCSALVNIKSPRIATDHMKNLLSC